MGGCCSRNAAKAVEEPAERWAKPRTPRTPPPPCTAIWRPSLEALRGLNRPDSDELGGEEHKLGGDAAVSSTLRSGASCLDVMLRNTVLVVVRVRPLSQREHNARSGECLQADGTTSLSVQREGEKDVKFTFDCIMRQGVAQRDVFDRTGRPLLHKVLEGYNGCLFAYGQTGSGKTYTMQGEARSEHKGVIPLLCVELFDQIKERGSAKTFTVSCSVLEIYNERVRDLLADQGGEDLAIREDAAPGGRGLHVEGLAEVSAASCEELLMAIEKGQARRAVGQTNVNEHSSRSHAVITLRIATCDVDDGEGVTTTVSKLHLVDLAGSERQKATGATGERLREGVQINLSLSALGNVINALTDAKGRHVPYRDSKLTRLLQDSLGGNSYTVMICNVSPARLSAEETLSSLRFAERAKKVENTATVNRDPKSERIVELLQENKALRAKVARLEAHVERLEANYE